MNMRARAGTRRGACFVAGPSLDGPTAGRQLEIPHGLFMMIRLLCMHELLMIDRLFLHQRTLIVLILHIVKILHSPYHFKGILFLFYLNSYVTY